MNDVTTSRSNLLALRDERRAMQDGYVFLDEKCLLLAGAMLHELRQYEALLVEVRRLQEISRGALRQALMRHGLQGLQCYPPLAQPGLSIKHRSLLGIPLQEGVLVSGEGPKSRPVYLSPEAEGCRAAHGMLLERLAELAALSGNLERLYREYRRTMRRAHAIQDVLLPEVSSVAAVMETTLDEQEREEMQWARRGLGE